MLRMTTDRRRRALLCVTEPGERNTQHVGPKMRATEPLRRHLNERSENNKRTFTECNLLRNHNSFIVIILLHFVRIWWEMWAN
jgi:hypothetical protein